MKSLLKTYESIGKGMGKFMNWRATQHPLAGMEMFVPQTPGKIQYYRAENEPFIPDEIKYQIRMPTRYAKSQAQMAYLNEVEEKMSEFLAKQIHFDYLKGDRPIDLNLTLQEVSVLASANEEIKNSAANGELQKLLGKCAEIDNEVQTGYLKVMDALEDLLRQIQNNEDDVYTQLVDDLQIEGIAVHAEQDNSLLSFAPSAGSIAIQNLTLIKDHINSVENEDTRSEFINLHAELHALMGARVEVLNAQLTLQESLVENVTKDDPAASNDLSEIQDNHNKFKDAYENNKPEKEAADSDAKVLMGAVQELFGGRMNVLMTRMEEHRKIHAEKGRLYHMYFDANAPDSMDEFRFGLLQHLAGSIVVKDHRIRYQKEQFDRLIYSNANFTLKRRNQTLKEFAENYAYLIEFNTNEAFHGKCRKIEANYDNYETDSLKPFNATLFYYMFSGNAYSRTWAQWILSTIRYPNEKVRRAYMNYYA